MATPTPTLYGIPHGVKALCGRSSALPAWMTVAGVALNKLVAIPNSALADGVNATTCGIFSYSGFSLKRDTNEIFVIGAGGHTDTPDDGVYSFGPKNVGLMADDPRWGVRSPSTPWDQVLVAQAPKTNMVQLNGHPTSRHLYDRVHYSAAVGQFIELGGTGTWNIPDDDKFLIHTYDPVTDTFNAPLDIGFDAGVKGYSNAVNHETGEIWTNGLWKYNPVTKAFTPGITGGSVPGPGVRFPFVVAPSIGYAFNLMFGNGWSVSDPTLQASKVNLATGIWSAVTFNSSPGLDAFLADAAANGVNTPSLGLAMDFDEENRTFLTCRGTAGQEGKFYIVTPHGEDPWDIALMTLAAGSVSTAAGTLTTQAISGLFGKLKYVPALKGFIVWPMGGNPDYKTQPMYFLRTA